MPKGVRNLKISFGETHLTHYGGMFLIQWFCKKLKIKWILQKYVKFHQQNNRYTTGELLIALLHTIIAGLGRLNSTRILQYNGSFQAIVGLRSFPNATTLRRFLLRLTPQALRQILSVHDRLRQKILSYPKTPTSIILDLDTTILTVYGRLEEARKGYNPHKPGRLSYHPLLCFEAHTQDCLHERFCPGGESTGLEKKRFIEESLSKLPPHIYRIRLRGDSKWYDRKILPFLDDNNIGYTIVARVSQPIQRIVGGLRYHKFKRDWEAAEFKYQPHQYTPHRFIVVRRFLSEEDGAQLTLFTLKNYAYHVIVTNLDLPPESVWRFYCDRARIELNIKELKWDYYLSKIPTKSFSANQSYFHLLLFAYNIVNWFKRLCLPKQFHYATLQTIRREFLVLPARLVRSGHKNLLKLPAGYVYNWVFDYAIKRIQKLEAI
jgi:hypothetical protein